MLPPANGTAVPPAGRADGHSFRLQAAFLRATEGGAVSGEPRVKEGISNMRKKAKPKASKRKMRPGKTLGKTKTLGSPYRGQGGAHFLNPQPLPP